MRVLEQPTVRTATLSFGKDMTSIIKGFAIVIMIILHCGNPEWFDITIPAFEAHPKLAGWLSMGKLCVGIFAFMVGYGYAFSKKKDWRYSLSHIWKMLLPFWIVLFVFTLPVIIVKGEWGGVNLLILNMFGVNSEWCWVSWFVAFYIYAMIVMPFMARLIDRWPIMGTGSLVILTFGLAVVVHQFIPNYSGNDWTQRLFDCLITSPTMLLGYLFARKQWFTQIKLPKHWSMAVVALLLMAVAIVLRYYIGWVDLFYAPLFILGVLILFNLFKLPVLTKVMTVLGNTSLYMWFFHSLFFTLVVRSAYQPFITFTNQLWIIIPWTILLSFGCSWGLHWVVQRIINSNHKR